MRVNLGIKQQLVAFVALGFVFLFVVAGAGLWGQTKQAQQIVHIADLTSAFSTHARALELHNALRNDVQSVLYSAGDSQMQKHALGDLRTHAQALQDHAARPLAAGLTADLTTAIVKQKQALANASRAALSLGELASTDATAAASALSIFTEDAARLKRDAEETMLTMLGAVTVAKQRGQAASTNAIRWVIGGVISCLIVMWFLLYLLALGILRPMRNLLNATNQLASGDGDLTRRIPDANGEFGLLARSTNHFIEHVQSIVGSVNLAGREVNAAARSVSGTSAQLSARTEAQAANLEQTSASMEELTAAVKQNASSAQDAARNAKHAREVAARGGNAMQRLVTTMHALNGSAQQVNEIVSIIDSIAFQTNILALNAAVEAARAGTQGKGFAVVAHEVRALAQRSADAAKQIKKLMGDSLNHVKDGTQQAHAADSTIAEMVRAISGASDMIANIARASHEQLTGIEQINHAVLQLDTTTQHNAGLVEQTTKIAGVLGTQAEVLMTQLSRFKLSSGDSNADNDTSVSRTTHNTLGQQLLT